MATACKEKITGNESAAKSEAEPNTAEVCSEPPTDLGTELKVNKKFFHWKVWLSKFEGYAAFDENTVLFSIEEQGAFEIARAGGGFDLRTTFYMRDKQRKVFAIAHKKLIAVTTTIEVFKCKQSDDGAKIQDGEKIGSFEQDIKSALARTVVRAVAGGVEAKTGGALGKAAANAFSLYNVRNGLGVAVGFSRKIDAGIVGFSIFPINEQMRTQIMEDQVVEPDRQGSPAVIEISRGNVFGAGWLDKWEIKINAESEVPFSVALMIPAFKSDHDATPERSTPRISPEAQARP